MSVSPSGLTVDARQEVEGGETSGAAWRSLHKRRPTKCTLWCCLSNRQSMHGHELHKTWRSRCPARMTHERLPYIPPAIHFSVCDAFCVAVRNTIPDVVRVRLPQNINVAICSDPDALRRARAFDK